MFADPAESTRFAADLDEEQQVEPAQQDGVDGCEVAGHAAWDRRNSDHVTFDCVGAGSMSAFLRICQIVDAAMVWPSPSSSPWMRR